jgi:O-acetyl-ADP-ribose deacetylase (regulator of RNase III)
MEVGTTRFIFKKGDITKEQVDAIINAANSHLAGGGGVDGAIHKAGGPSIAAELKQIIAKIKECSTGEAVITGAGKLKAQHVIHAVGPVWHGGKRGEAEDLENAYFNSLMLAKEYGAKSVAFPAISTGAYNYPALEAAKIALKICKSFCEEHSCFEEVRFILFSDEIVAAFSAARDELK